MQVANSNSMAERKLRKTRVGTVVSNSMDKTISVLECNVGDKVRIMETRPLSRRKCWRLVEIVERAK